jgi:hypothetical protein
VLSAVLSTGRSRPLGNVGIYRIDVREVEPAHPVDFQQLDGDLLTFLDDLVHPVHASGGELGYVHQAFFPWKDFHESTRIP